MLDDLPLRIGRGKSLGRDERALLRRVARSRACAAVARDHTHAACCALLDRVNNYDDDALDAYVHRDGFPALVECILWRMLLRRKDVDARALRSRFARRWRRVALRVVIRVSSRVVVRVLACGEAPSFPSYLLRDIRVLARYRRLDPGASCIDVVRASGGAAVAWLAERHAGVPLVRRSAQRGLGVVGSPAFVRLLAASGCGVVRFRDASRLGRASAPGVRDLLAVLGYGVRLRSPGPAPDRPGSRRPAEDALLDGCVVGPASRVRGVRVAPGMRLGAPAFGDVAAVEAVGGPDRPLVLLAALAALLFPGRVVALRAGTGGPAYLRCGARCRAADLAGFAALGADAAALDRAAAAYARAAGMKKRRGVFFVPDQL